MRVLLQAARQQGVPYEPAEAAMESFAKLASYGLANQLDVAPLKTLAMRRAWRGRQTSGIPESCQFMDALYKSGVQRAVGR